MPLSPSQTAELKAALIPGEICSPHNLGVIGHLSLIDREQFAFETGTMVLYMGDEVQALGRAEEEAALRAAPPDYPLGMLNGLNIGAGNRSVSPYVTPIDITRDAEA